MTAGAIEDDPAVPVRCSDLSRSRAESPIATAPPARRLLLLEVPGPWGRAGLTASRLHPVVGAPLAAAAEVAGVRVQLIRRPGRHPGPRRPETALGRQAWALADPGAGVVRWGWWQDAAQLRELDLAGPLDPAVDAGTGSQRVALVCTHARHDVCCALRGRPVAAALAAGGLGRDVWETSHLGGDRFAANVLLLPEGELFGGLEERTALDTVLAVDRGRIPLAHYRGRVGTPPPEQAAVHLAAVALGDDRRGAVRVVEVAPAGTSPAGPSPGGRRLRALLDHAGARYCLEMIEGWAEPERLTCAAVELKAARRFDLLSLVRC